MTELIDWEELVLWENRDNDEDGFVLELDYEDYMTELDAIIILSGDECNIDDSVFWLEMSYSRFDIWNLWDEENYTKTDWEEFVESRLYGNALCL